MNTNIHCNQARLCYALLLSIASAYMTRCTYMSVHIWCTYKVHIYVCACVPITTVPRLKSLVLNLSMHLHIMDAVYLWLSFTLPRAGCMYTSVLLGCANMPHNM